MGGTNLDESMLSRTESTGRVSESCTVAQDQERELIVHRYGVSVAREYNYTGYLVVLSLCFTQSSGFTVLTGRTVAREIRQA